MVLENTKNLSLVRRRRAIYSGLFPFIQGDELMKALCLWQHQFSSLPSFAIGNFVTELVDNTPLLPKRASIHLSITSSLMVEEENLAPDPLEEMYAYLVRTQGSDKADQILAKAKQEAVKFEQFDNRGDSCKVYEMVINQFLTGVSQKNSEAVKEVENSILSKFIELKVGDDVIKSVKSWFNDNTILQISLEVEKLQDSLNAAYVTSCNWLGPADTDKIMSAAIEHVENDEISQNFSPRVLL